jgi:tetratricopeptide (TPR) repeat protein
MNRKQFQTSVQSAAVATAHPTGGAPELLAVALRHHRSGELAQAEARYREILAIDPNHADSLHLLGVIAHQVGRHEQAIDLIGKAIALNDRVPAFHNNIGLTLRAIGRLEDAVAHYTRGISLKPDFAEAYKNLGDVLKQQGKADLAVMQYQQVLLLKPDAAEIHNILGGALCEQGRLDDGLAHYERALALRPDYAEAHNNLANVLQEQGKLDEAVARYQQALVLRPDFAEAHNNLGNMLRKQSKLDEAVAQYRRALAIKPDYAEAHCNLGPSLSEQGELDEAVAHWHQALALNPKVAETYNNLGVALGEQGKLDEAVKRYQQALALRPDYAEAHNNLGVAVREQGQLDEAVARYRQALTLRPDYAAAHNNLGVALREQGKLDEALAQFQRAVALEPSVAAAYCNLGEVLREQGELDEAVAQYRQALALKPDYAKAHSHLGVVLQDQGKLDDALANYRQALALEPDFAGAYVNLGNVLRELGRLTEARHVYERAIELAPQKPGFYHGLAQVKRFAQGDTDLAAMEKLLLEPVSLSAEDRKQLGFALGKAYGDLGDHERAFRHLLEGNALKRQEIIYDEAAKAGRFARIREVFTPEVMREKRGLGDPSPLPVFIVGMPRSGTTLIEQILASHPRVFGAGELKVFGRAVAGLSRPDGARAPFPEAVSCMEGEQLRRLGEGYVATVRALAPNAERITDKMPHNFQFAGLIHLVLPNARMIHARRDPIDTCLSCFSKLFGGDHSYCYDLAELGRYYRAYEALMAHWRKVLPPDVMLEVQYEEVTADLECQARRIVGHCGLEWEDACLLFHKNERPVRTASAVQVRQPIYRTSVGRWRPYEHLLGPLIEALRADPVGDPEAISTAMDS